MLTKFPLRHLGALFLALVIGNAHTPAEAFDIRLGAGEAGTFSHFSGRLLCRGINRQTTDLECSVVPAPSDMHNLTNLRSGSLDLALVDSRTLYDAANKTGEFKFLDIRYDNLRILFPLYGIPIALVVRPEAKITSIDELKGKRINAGTPKSARHRAVDTIIGAKGWSPEDFSLFAEISASQSQDTIAFCHGNIQAMVHIGVHPDASLQQLFTLCQAELVDLYDGDIQKLVDGHPAFLKFDIPANTYPKQTKAVRTFGTEAVLVASESLDEQTAYRIIEAIETHREQLQNAHPALLANPGEPVAKDGLGVPLHPGAAKFFSEPGH